jgi:F-type H+-transporting ATPase subunit epsilon
MKKITFEITTPERVVFKDEVDQVTLPTKMGQITILPDHIPLVASLVAGELIVKKEKEIIPMSISGGFVEVRPQSKVVILADTAERLEEIDEKRAEEARQRAAELLQQKRVDAEEYASLSAKLQKELARLKVARKHRHLRGSQVERV